MASGDTFLTCFLALEVLAFVGLRTFWDYQLYLHRSARDLAPFPSVLPSFFFVTALCCTMNELSMANDSDISNLRFKGVLF